MTLYSFEIEHEMKKFYHTLNEKDKRRYAGVEALKLGHGGIGYISQLFACDPQTVSKGQAELKALSGNGADESRIRQEGGGRKPYHQTRPKVDEQFQTVLQDHTAGNPMKETVVWTDLTPSQIQTRYHQTFGEFISETVVRKLLKKHDYRCRKALKKKTMKTVKYRNEQFENIFKLLAQYRPSQNPILSIDTKKKEHLGNFYREGRLYTREVIETFDHDFTSIFSDGVIIPHGIYDLKKNVGYINIGTSKDTAEFVGDCLRFWWYHYGRFTYGDASSILLLCDGGGSNNSRHYLFKEQLQKLADEIGIEIRVAHYPPYTSKYNPIEHRLFPHVTRACQGVVFETAELVEQLIQKTNTKTGLSVVTNMIKTVYETGKKVTKNFKKNMKIAFDDYLPKWNYCAIPTAT